MKKARFKKRQLILFIINALLIIGVLICLFVYRSTSSALIAQDAAKRWAGESELHYTQISCFIDKTAAPTLETIQSFSSAVDEALLAASLEPATAEGSLWTHAYSSETTLQVAGDYGSTEATAWGIGGDFFLFHPLALRSGSYIAEDDFMDDRVVIDEDLAWKTFGSVDIVGLSVTINGLPYQIAGVVSREDDSFSTKTYQGGARLYLPYSTLAKITENPPITCYEIVLPNPISAFGLGVVQENFLKEQQEDNNVAVVENSGRFTVEPIIKVLTNFNERTIQEESIAYPYWENAARLVENQLAWILLCGFIFSLLPLGCLIYLIVKEIKHVKHYLKKFKKSV